MRLGQGRAGLRRKVKETGLQPNKPVEVVPPLEKQKSESSVQPQVSMVSTSQTQHIPLTPVAPKQPLKPKHFT